jgi:translation initiation factor 3 subunit J
MSTTNMSDEEWDADGFQPGNVAKPGVTTDKWEGEDEDDDVRDAWDKSDSEDDKSKESTSEEIIPAKTKPKKKLADKIAEREAMKEKESAEKAPLTEEEKLEQKLQQQKMEESANIQLMRDMCGLKENKIDSLVPETKEDFDHFGKAISEKIQTFASSEHYSDLIENITKDICVDLNTASLKKLKLHIESLHSAKLKEEKASKSKLKGKGITVKMDLEKDIYGGSIGDYDGDMDDFM